MLQTQLLILSNNNLKIIKILLISFSLFDAHYIFILSVSFFIITYKLLKFTL